MVDRYSILVLRGTQIRRFAISPKEVRQLLLLGITILVLIGMHYYDQLELEKRKTAAVAARAQSQREKLLVLRDRTQEVQDALARWKSLGEKIHVSMPHRYKANHAYAYEGEQLQSILVRLDSELEQLIAALPTEWPVRGRVVSGIGMRASPVTGRMEFHAGLDIPSPIGTPVLAPGDARVESIDNNHGTIVLDHGRDVKTHYAHLSKILVNEGERIRKGQAIAQVGNKGKSTGPHLHYEVRVAGVAVDPRLSLLDTTASK